MTRLIPSELRDILGPYKRSVAALAAFAVLLAAIELCTLGLFYFLGNAVFGRSPGGRLAAWLPGPFASGDPAAIPLLALLFLAAVLARFLAGMLFEFWIARWRAAVLTDLQSSVMDKYLHAPLGLYFQKKQGDLINGVFNLPFKSTEGLVILPKIIYSVVLTAFFGLAFLCLSPWVFAGALALGVLFGGGIGYLSRRVMVPSNQGRVAAQRAQAEIAAETTAGIRVIRSLGAEPLWSRRFLEQVSLYNQLWRKEYLMALAPNRVIEFLVQAIFAVAVAAAAALLPPERLTVLLPLLATYVFGLMRLYPAFSTLGQGTLMIAGNLPHARALQALLRIDPDPLEAPGSPAGPLRSAIEFRDAAFAYAPGRPALDGVSFSIPASRVTAVVGPSGSGKSTVLHLLLKFVEPREGRILVDGTDLRTMDRAEWLKRVGLVDQDVFLFHGTIAENVRMGNPGAAAEELRRACEQAGLGPFLDALPRGLETVVGDRGLTVSGGERQRIAIARALIRDPDLLLFDEATSALDSETEARVLETVWRLRGARTLVMIAHRLASVRSADHLVVLDRGRVAEHGTWEELLARRGALWRMAVEQGAAADSPVRR